MSLAAEVSGIERDLRDAGISLGTLLEKADIDRSTWTRWRSGAVRGPQLTNWNAVKAAASALLKTGRRNRGRTCPPREAKHPTRGPLEPEFVSASRAGPSAKIGGAAWPGNLSLCSALPAASSWARRLQMASYFSEKLSDNPMVLRSARLSEAQSLIRLLAEPRPVGDSVKSAIRRAGRRLRGWSLSRVRAVWYADERAAVRAHELDALRRLTAQARSDRAAAKDLRELHDRVSRLERLLLATADPEGHGADIAALRQNGRLALRALGARD
jgi:hypothetical protein